jgi:hypothetical protein
MSTARYLALQRITLPLAGVLMALGTIALLIG